MSMLLMLCLHLINTARHVKAFAWRSGGSPPSFRALTIRMGCVSCRGAPNSRVRGRRCARPRRLVAGSQPVYQLSMQMSSSGGADADADNQPLAAEPMAMLYQEWTLDQDKALWENRHLSLASLASMFGRGLRGVERRLEKLKDVKSSAYGRLFSTPRQGVGDSLSADPSEGDKLVPVSVVLQRIRYDPSIPSERFSVQYYDRLEDEVMESPLMAPNTSIKGRSTLWVDALPEHRIRSVKYLDRVVWDKDSRVDRVFSDPGLVSVIETYDQWKRERDEVVERARQRQLEVSGRLEQALGSGLCSAFLGLVTDFEAAVRDPTRSTKLESEKFVESSLGLFHSVDGCGVEDDEALDMVSELLALHPDADLREAALLELSRSMGRSPSTPPPVRNLPSGARRRELPELREEDLSETFVRGSGPGGQKINKTSSRVVLVHIPTQLRVECQETRSLHQNRKLARRRLQLKLDEHYHGSESVERVKAMIASSKKSKAKARSRARQRRKQATKEAEAEEEEDEL